MATFGVWLLALIVNDRVTVSVCWIRLSPYQWERIEVKALRVAYNDEPSLYPLSWEREAKTAAKELQLQRRINQTLACA